MENKVAIIAGASGLVGGHLLDLLLKDSSYSKVISLVRSESNVKHQKLQEEVINFERLSPESIPAEANVIFCCLGTTLKKAGSKAAFKTVDFDYVLKLAMIGEKKNIPQFHVISAMGANRRSWFYYNRLKGEMENFLQKLKISSISIHRPSLLLGDRKEFRFFERLGIAIMKIFGGLFSKSKQAIHAQQVAYAMLNIARNPKPGATIYTSDELAKFR